MEKHLEIPSRIESIKEVEKLIDMISNELDLPNSLYGNVLISVIEAVNNAVIHGNQQDTSKKVLLSVLSDDNKLIISVKDEGPGFDYRVIPDPTSPENLENIHGRGIFLMNQLSDNIEFEDNGSKVNIEFHFNS
ncbi:MAG: ATP-binding protein [bacterium]